MGGAGRVTYAYGFVYMVSLCMDGWVERWMVSECVFISLYSLESNPIVPPSHAEKGGRVLVIGVCFAFGANPTSQRFRRGVCVGGIG